jgi:hypothetical protein
VHACPRASQAYGGADFPPALTSGERQAYHSLAAAPELLAPEVQDAVADLRWAQVEAQRERARTRVRDQSLVLPSGRTLHAFFRVF